MIMASKRRVAALRGPQGSKAPPAALEGTRRLRGLRLSKAPLASKPPVAEHILFVTLTDGEENQSRLYTLAGIRERIAERTASGWTFLFLSAGPDAYTEAAGLGIQRDATMAFRADRAGTQQAMDLITERTLQFRRGQRWGNNPGKPQGNEGGQQA